MIALIKEDKNGLDIMYPIPDWVDPIAFSVFDCYGYSLCENYEVTEEPEFEFITVKIVNPYKESEDDPDYVTQRLATQTK